MATSKVVLGGDDVRSVVVDCGSWVVRLGSAGDDSPKAIIPTAVGVRQQSKSTSSEAAKGAVEDVEMADGTSAAVPHIAGDLILAAPHLLRDVHPVCTQDLATGDAPVRSWDAMQSVWKAGYTALNLKPSDGPLFIVEPTRMWRDADRASALQHAFEGLSVPAAYIGRGSAMAAFASARTTACVLDVGAQGATAVPVVDGYSLSKPTRKSPVGGAYLTEKTREWIESCLESRPGYDGNMRSPGKRMRGDQGRKDQFLRAAHEVKRERIISDDKVRKFVVTDLSSDKFAEGHKQFYRLRVVDDLKAGILRVDQRSTSNGNSKDSNGKSASTPNLSGGQKAKPKSTSQGGEGSVRSEEKEDKDAKDKSKDKSAGIDVEGNVDYTLPDGNVLTLSEKDGYQIANCLFTTKADCDWQSLPDLMYNCITASDVDLRRDLFGAVVVTGGSSMIGGVVERLTRELSLLTPQAYKLRLHAFPNATERLCGPWIGGSIVSSLSTFQQAWVSKAEYDELGAHGALRKCP